MTLSNKRAWRTRAAGWLRLGVYVLALCGLSAWWLIHRVSAAVDERSLDLGHKLAKLTQLAAGTTTMDFNGERLTLTSGSTERSVSAVLDRFGASCAQSSGGITEALQHMIASGTQLPNTLMPASALTLRSQNGASEGSSACFARSTQGGFDELFARMQRALETGEFAALGQLRYVFARRHEGASTTHVITVWSDGALALEKMFPASGDAPGDDLFAGARPADAQRLVSAKVEGTKHHMALYQTTRDSEQALLDFDAPLTAQGFKVADLPVSEQNSAIPARVFVKSDDVVVLIADPEPRAGQTLVSAFRLLNGGYVMMQP